MNPLFLQGIEVKEELPEEAYFSRIPLVRQVAEEGLCFHAPVTFLIGENGSGKSTLMEAVAVSLGFNAEGGTRNFRFSTRESHSSLYEYLTCLKGKKFRDGFFLRAESFYNVASNVDELNAEDARMLQSYGGISLHEQSHGESFLALIENRFGENSLFLLDEPEAALSPGGLMRLLCVIHDLEQKNCQFLISTHSPILMSYPGAVILEADENGLHETSYRETQHYKITREFMEHPERMYHYLFDETSEA